ncbi:MAG: MarR family transcriptional regulator [Halanaerobiales bacterium]|nr:MarR family transcriptional regulator [Halanaerobiales bacterium]
MDANKSRTAQNLMEVFSRFKRLHWNRTPKIGLKHSELMVLHCLKQKVASDSSGIMVSELSNILKVTAPTVTQLIKGLETNGYVERSRDQNDRRVVRIKLTDKGESVIRGAMDAFYDSFEGLVEYLGEEKSNELAELLSKVFNYFDEMK